MTKTLDYYADIPPGWQDMDYRPYLNPSRPKALPILSDGYKRFKVSVTLPCFGGSADATEAAPATVTEVTP